VHFGYDRLAHKRSSVHEEAMVMATNGFEVRRLSGSVGAEILGIDLGAEPGHNVIAEIRKIWLDSGVIFFRDQDLPPAKFLNFARQFGEVVEYPFIKGIEGFPEIIPVTKLEHEKNNFGGIWHSDTAYLEKPPMGTMLIAREVPPYGGDTLFASAYLAYETLSEGMKRMLDGLIAINSSAKADVTRTREDRMRDGGKSEAKKEYVSEHPVVRTHPETGRKALYINVAHTLRFKDMTEQESAPLLDFLFQHQTKPEFTCRFGWRAGSLAFWDNRCVLHNPVNDYHGFRRVMHRVTLAGDTPH
jgi:alpha-ketoglutarate-dependent taurine dioxygenase